MNCVKIYITGESGSIKGNKYDDHDRELIEEINRKYENNIDEADLQPRNNAKRFLLGMIAFLVASSFILLIISQGVTLFRSSSFELLRLSWITGTDPMARDLKEKVVRIEVKGSDGVHQIQGSGFNVDQSGLIVTNRHLLEDAETAIVTFPSAGSFEVNKWHISTEVDLAIIELYSEGLPVAKMATSIVCPRDEVMVIGNPLNLNWVVTRGHVLSYRFNSGRRLPLLIIDALVHPGSSGSPVFNMEGEVVGIIFATLHSYDGTEIKGLALERKEIKLFLQDFLSGD